MTISPLNYEWWRQIILWRLPLLTQRVEARSPLRVTKWCSALSYLEMRESFYMISLPTTRLHVSKNSSLRLYFLWQIRKTLQQSWQRLSLIEKEEARLHAITLLVSWPMTMQPAPAASGLEMELAPWVHHRPTGLSEHTATPAQCQHRSKSRHNGAATH